MESYPRNIVPIKYQASVVKIWQRLLTAKAVIETQKAMKAQKVDKFDYITHVFRQHAELLLVNFAGFLAPEVTLKVLMASNMKNLDIEVNGKQLWETNWETMNSYIVHTILPIWFNLVPGGRLPPEANYDEYLLELRKILFDHTENKSFMTEYIETSSGDVIVNPLYAPNTSNDDTSVINVVNVDANAADDTYTTTTTTQMIKKMKPTVKRPFDPNWFPMEWLAFVFHGPFSYEPHKNWVKLKSVLSSDLAAASNTPMMTTTTPTTLNTTSNNNSQRIRPRPMDMTTRSSDALLSNTIHDYTITNGYHHVLTTADGPIYPLNSTNSNQDFQISSHDNYTMNQHDTSLAHVPNKKRPFQHMNSYEHTNNTMEDTRNMYWHPRHSNNDTDATLNLQLSEVKSLLKESIKTTISIKEQFDTINQHLESSNKILLLTSKMHLHHYTLTHSHSTRDGVSFSTFEDELHDLEQTLHDSNK